MSRTVRVRTIEQHFDKHLRRDRLVDEEFTSEAVEAQRRARAGLVEILSRWSPEAVQKGPAPENKAVSPPPEDKADHNEPFPDDFPAARLLREAGLSTYYDVGVYDDLTGIPGIGDATADAIIEALP